MKKYLVHIGWFVIAIVALSGGYYWGNAGATAMRAGFAGVGSYGLSTRRFGGGATSGGFIAGQIAQLGGGSMTLQLANGNSRVVFYSSSTPVSEPTIVSPNTLKVGTNVMVGGTSNSDGSLTATTIRVRATGASGGSDAAVTSGQ